MNEPIFVHSHSISFTNKIFKEPIPYICMRSAIPFTHSINSHHIVSSKLAVFALQLIHSHSDNTLSYQLSILLPIPPSACLGTQLLLLIFQPQHLYSAYIRFWFQIFSIIWHIAFHSTYLPHAICIITWYFWSSNTKLEDNSHRFLFARQRQLLLILVSAQWGKDTWEHQIKLNLQIFCSHLKELRCCKNLQWPLRLRLTVHFSFWWTQSWLGCLSFSDRLFWIWLDLQLDWSSKYLNNRINFPNIIFSHY